MQGKIVGGDDHDGGCGHCAANLMVRVKPLKVDDRLPRLAADLGARGVLAGDGEKARTKTRNQKIEKQTAGRGSAGDKAGPGCRAPHLGRGSDTLVLVRGSCSVNQKRGRRRERRGGVVTVQ